VQLRPPVDRRHDPVTVPPLVQAACVFGAPLSRALGVVSEAMTPKGAVHALERRGCLPHRNAGGDEIAGDVEHLVGDLPGGLPGGIAGDYPAPRRRPKTRGIVAA
jgi:hypothetical protein